MKPARFTKKGRSLSDMVYDIISEGLPEEVADKLPPKTIDDITGKLIEEVVEHMDAQYDKFRDEVTS